MQCGIPIRINRALYYFRWSKDSSGSWWFIIPSTCTQGSSNMLKFSPKSGLFSFQVLVMVAGLMVIAGAQATRTHPVLNIKNAPIPESDARSNGPAHEVWLSSRIRPCLTWMC